MALRSSRNRKSSRCGTSPGFCPPELAEPAPPQAIVALLGKVEIRDQEISWLVTNNADDLAQAFGRGGRLVVRLHCGYLADREGRPLSAILEGITGIRSPHPPGGVLESWFYVRM